MASTIKQKILKAYNTENPHEAFGLVEEINALIDQNPDFDTRQLDQLVKTVAQLKYLALRYYSNTEIGTLFKAHMADILHLPDAVKLEEQVYDKMVTIDYVDERDDLKKIMQKSIVTCDQQLTKGKITLGNEEVRPTVNNWIKAYISSASENKTSNILLARFFSSNISIAKLEPKDRARVKRLLDLYRYLQKSSASLGTYENFVLLSSEGDGAAIYQDGKIESLYSDAQLVALEQKAKEKKLDAEYLTELQIQYPERFNKYASQNLIKGPQQSSPQQIQAQSEAFFAEQRQKHQTASSAILPQDQQLLVLAQSGLGLSSTAITLAQLKQSLVMKIGSEQSLMQLLRDKSVAQLVKSNIPEHLDTRSKGLLAQSIQLPVGLQALLEILFLEAFKLDEATAKWHAYQVLQRIPMPLREYKTIVTYDVANNQLAWRY
jgi:hypothetical protein